eukprot:2388032-Rhodomonas_salina.1
MLCPIRPSSASGRKTRCTPYVPGCDAATTASTGTKKNVSFSVVKFKRHRGLALPGLQVVLLALPDTPGYLSTTPGYRGLS